MCVCIARTVQAQYIDAGWDKKKFLYLPLTTLKHGLGTPTLHVCGTIIIKKSTQSTSNLHMNAKNKQTSNSTNVLVDYIAKLAML